MLRFYKSLLIVLFALFVQSCATTTGDSQSTTASPDTSNAEDEQFVATPNLAPRERFSKALRMLENGEVGQAQAELKAYIAAVASSRSRNARALLEQITTPIETYFPSEYFTVSLGDGESLSTLARTYLGDPLKFYALARYNTISAPSRVFVGQEVRIPLTESARLARDNPPVIDEVEEATALLEPAEEVQQETPTAIVDLIEETVSIEDLIGAGNYEEAIEFANNAPEGSLDQATHIAIYLGYAEQMLSDNPFIAADAYHQLADLYLESNDLDSALLTLQKAVSANPDHTGAAQSLQDLESRLVSTYYRSASAAFGRQDLDTTIEYADKVLAIDPDHANAQLYRAQAVELKDRLEQLNSGN